MDNAIDYWYQKYQKLKRDLGWISVKDRLPEVGHFVITCVDDKHPASVSVACLLSWGWWDGEQEVAVDYWMEIPQLP